MMTTRWYTTQMIVAEIGRMRLWTDHPRIARELEDRMRHAVLSAIAYGNNVDSPRDLAREALRSSEVLFERCLPDDAQKTASVPRG